MKLSKKVLVSLVAVTASGCSMMMSKGRDAATRTPAGMTGTEKAAFVEGYLEYVGPPEKWAGPGTLMVHLVTRDLTAAEIVVRPDLLAQLEEQDTAAKKTSTEPRARVLPVSTAATAKPSGQVARDKLNYLAEAIQADSDSFVGCLYPVRARLIRADGSFVEKFGCRSWRGWASIASNTVSEMFAMALKEKPVSPDGAVGAPERKTASKQ